MPSCLPCRGPLLCSTVYFREGNRVLKLLVIVWREAHIKLLFLLEYWEFSPIRIRRTLSSLCLCQLVPADSGAQRHLLGRGAQHCQSKVFLQGWHSVGLLVGWPEEEGDGKQQNDSCCSLPVQWMGIHKGSWLCTGLCSRANDEMEFTALSVSDGVTRSGSRPFVCA